jgi:Ca2+-binding RTX toxin-like protein
MRSVRRHCHRPIAEPVERRSLLAVLPVGTVQSILSNSATAFDLRGDVDPGGNLFVAWSDRNSGSGLGNDVFVRRFDAAANALTSAVTANSSTAGAQMKPDVAVLSSGGVVVVWQSQNEDGDSWGVYGQLFNASLSPTGGAFLVNQSTTGGQVTPVVSATSSGFAVAWANQTNDGASDIYARNFNNSATATTSEFKVSGDVEGLYTEPDITSGAIVWTFTNPNDSYDANIEMRRFNSAGVVGSPTTVNQTIANDQLQPVIADAGAGFQIAWVSNAQAGSNIALRRFNADGTPATSELNANDDADADRQRPTLHEASSGLTLIGWTSVIGGSSFTVVRMLGGSSVLIGDETQIGSTGSFRTGFGFFATSTGELIEIHTGGPTLGFGTAALQRYESVFDVIGSGGNDTITVSSGGAAVVVNGVSQSFDPVAYKRIRVQADAGNDTVNTANATLPAQIFGGDGADVITGTSLADSIEGGSGNDSINAGDGDDYVFGDNDNDTIQGGGGNDTLSAGAGKNLLFGGDGNDRVNGSGGRDNLNGDNGDDRLYGFGGDDTMGGGAGVDRLFGGSGNDLLGGNGSNDKLYGEDNDDTLSGGTGSDILDGGNGTDTANEDSSDILVSIEL